MTLKKQSAALEMDKLKAIPYFVGLKPTDLESIASTMIQKTAQKGEIFLREGEWSDYLYFLISGLVKVYKTSVGGKEQILHLAVVGDSLNDVSTFDGGPNAASMLAMTPVTMYAMKKSALKYVLREYPRIALNVIKALANRVRRDSNLVEELSSNQVTGRLARLLLKYADMELEEGLHLTQKDMANMIGTAREVVNRSLKMMEDRGSIRLGRHKVIILNNESLREMAKLTPETTPQYIEQEV